MIISKSLMLSLIILTIFTVLVLLFFLIKKRRLPNQFKIFLIILLICICSLFYLNYLKERALIPIVSSSEEVSPLSLCKNFAINKKALKEYENGNVKIYRTSGHKKAKGVDLKINYPFDWEAKEGNHPNMLQKFEKKEDDFTIYCMLLVKEPDLLSKLDNEIEGSDIFEYIDVYMLKSFIPDGSNYIDGNFIKLGSEKGAWIYYLTSQEAQGYHFDFHSLLYIFYYEEKFVNIQYLIFGLHEKIPEETEKAFISYVPLFNLMTHSIVFN